MPEPGTVCEVDYKPWSNISWPDVAKEIGWPVPGAQSAVSGSPAVVSRMIAASV